MPYNAKDNLREVIDELCCCENHLNSAYLHSEGTHNRTEIHAALKAVESALDSAQYTLLHFKD